MAPRPGKPAAVDPDGMFSGMVVFLLPKGIQSRRLQIWKQKLLQMGATIENNMSKKVTHIFALNSSSLDQLNHKSLKEYKGSLLSYEWLESCLKSGCKVSEDPYVLEMVIQKDATPKDRRNKSSLPPLEITDSDNKQLYRKKAKIGGVNSEAGGKAGAEYSSGQEVDNESKSSQASEMGSSSSMLDGSDVCTIDTSHKSDEACSNAANTGEQSTLYSPPDLNKNITEIFGKLIDIYRALGDDRRSFSYYKAIPVIEKLPFKIENADQVKDLPAIGKSLKDHIQEIITTGKLSKLEQFEKDEKVRTISLFGEVWGIGPATALKLYEKGHRTLDDLKNEESLTHSQRIGLQYFDDIKRRIPRDEVRDMEMLLQKAGEQLLPGVILVCGGSYRRGKASCGDMDIVITHPDGQSHKGFLNKFVQYLKDINFLRETLIFSTHSTEGTDSGVDTYFGLCTYPGREQRHRIDFKVYPRSIYAFGLIAWTGNDVLNRRLRLLAESKGYRLDDTGLFLATKGSSTKRGVKSSASVKCDTEREVFDLLGFPWLEPHERNL